MNDAAFALFQQHLPETAVNYCYNLWQRNAFLLKITRTRRSKLGDYCYHPAKGHQITINHDLNTFAFLITYLHEVAHLFTYKQYGNRKAPHGKEWKRNFRELLLPMMNESVFPQAILQALIGYAQNPTAATSSASPLKMALQQYDPIEIGKIQLASLAEGESFELNRRFFVRGEIRRTRVLCTEQKTGRKYTVAASALVKKINP